MCIERAVALQRFPPASSARRFVLGLARDDGTVPARVATSATRLDPAASPRVVAALAACRSAEPLPAALAFAVGVERDGSVSAADVRDPSGARDAVTTCVRDALAESVWPCEDAPREVRGVLCLSGGGG